MRGYFLCNMYLSSIQCGIQSAHVVAEMFIKYRGLAAESTLIEWATNHKTMILLNGGYQSELEEFYNYVLTAGRDQTNHYPFAIFHEELDALNGATTSVGIILPEKVYAATAEVREGLKETIFWDQLNDYERGIVVRLSRLKLAQ